MASPPSHTTDSGRLTTSDGIDLAWRYRAPVEKRGFILIHHGLGEHQGRYAHVVDRLVESGYAAMTFDARGHGESSGPRVHSPSVDRLMSDICAIRELGHQMSGEPFTVLYGHSFGGAMVLRCLTEASGPASAAVVTSPLLQPTQPVPAWKWHLGTWLAALVPRATFSLGLASDELMDDPELQQAHRLDPRNQKKVTARLGKDMLELGSQLLSLNHSLPCPTLLLHAKRDAITSELASRRLAAQIGDSCQFTSWDDSSHELHNSLQRDRVLSQIIEWVEGVRAEFAADSRVAGKVSALRRSG